MKANFVFIIRGLTLCRDWLAQSGKRPPINPKIRVRRTVVVERSNALVYLIISALELKVEGSNPGHPETFIFSFRNAEIRTHF